MTWAYDVEGYDGDRDRTLIRGYVAPMSSLSPDQVRARIDEFWQIMCGKSTGRLEELYSSSAQLLTGKARRPEAATVALARRARQIAAPGTHSEAELGLVEIELPEPWVAIASYTYRFHHTRPGGDATVQQRHTLFGRATQIFHLDESGALRIVHEHLSAATNPRKG
jgi:ketosteroid isomerase-like protein